MGDSGGMRLGVAHHLGWAVVVVADDDHRVVARRRLDLLDRDLPVAPVHHRGGPHAFHHGGDPLDDHALEALVADVRRSAELATSTGLDRLAADVAGPIASMSIRSWPRDFPTDIAVARRAPYESRADGVMYLETLAAAATERGWAVHRFDPRTVEAEAGEALGDQFDEVRGRPRRELGPPGTRDHRMALAATIVAGQLRIGSSVSG